MQDEAERQHVRELVARAQAGWMEALNELLQRYRPLIVASIGSPNVALGDPAVSSEDLAQEAAAAFIELVQAYRPERGSSFGAYLKCRLPWRMSHCIRRLRRPNRECIPIEDLASLLVATCSQLWRDADPPTANSVVRLHEALGQLTTKQRHVLYLHYWLDLPATAIATRLALSVRAIDRLRQRAEAKIYELWEEGVV